MTAESISGAFALRRSRGQAALVPYVTAGHPHPDVTVDVLSGLAEAGADVLELGIPFSDPLADGPTIQRSSFAALRHGTTTASALQALRAFRRAHDTPVVLFTYLNPVLRHGVDAFLSDAAEAGAQGLLITDLPAGADPPLEERMRSSGLDLVRLVAPTTRPERIPAIAASGSGFLYYISRTGVTGARASLRETLAEEVGRLREMVTLPVAVGFGISTPGQAAAVASVADGVVVGSALVRTLEEWGVDAGIRFVASLRAEMDAR
ncbi:MAG TPA: tryptophan synthase subunit alpha [Longimicrobiales bacterium]|nr:tryptophan synthase subunit alpha [Longimicrobiales bacterium]